MRSSAYCDRERIADWKQTRQPPRAHVCRARASRRAWAAQRPAPAVGAARLLQLPDPREGPRGQPRRRDPRAEGREAAAEDARRRPGREPALAQRRPTRCRAATSRCWSCSTRRVCGSRNSPASTSPTSTLPTARCACSARARRRACCPSASKAVQALRAWLAERRDLVKEAAARSSSAGTAAGSARARSSGASAAGRRAAASNVPRAPAPAPPFLRDAPARVEPRPARRAGTSRSCGHQYDTGLHAP